MPPLAALLGLVLATAAQAQAARPSGATSALGRAPAGSFGATYYAHPRGSGSTCSLAAPCGLPDVLAKVASDVADGLPRGGILVYLRGGTYLLATSTLTLTAAHSGDATHPVVLASYPRETARLIGGQQVINWADVSPADASAGHIQPAVLPHLRKATVHDVTLGDDYPGIDSSITELFWRGIPMQRGRWPDAPSYPAPHPAETMATKNGITGNTARSVTALQTLPSGAGRDWDGAARDPTPQNRPWIWATYTGYREVYGRISDVTGQVITLDRQNVPWETGGAPHSTTGSAAIKWFVTNLLDEVDQPGEYWIKKDSRTRTVEVYFYPPNGAQLASDEVLISTNGVGPVLWLDRTSHDITLDGIGVEVGQRHGVYLGGTRNTIRRCVVKNVSATGIWVAGSHHTIDRCTIRDTGAGAIWLGGRQADGSWFQSSRHPDVGMNGADANAANITVSNNDVGHTNRLSLGLVGAIRVLGTGPDTIRNNRFHHVPGNCVYLTGGTGTIIEKNDFDGCAWFGDDNGAIYASALGSYDWASSFTIRYNYFHDSPRPGYPFNAYGDAGMGAKSAVYLDDDGDDHLDLTGNQVYGNIVARFGDGRDHVYGCGFDAGHLYRCGTAFMVKSGGNTIRNNLIVETDVALAGAPGGLTPAQTAVHDNQVWNVPPYAARLITGIGSGNVVADPGFLDYPSSLVNQANGTVRIPSRGGSRVEHVPWHEIGPR